MHGVDLLGDEQVLLRVQDNLAAAACGGEAGDGEQGSCTGRGDCGPLQIAEEDEVVAGDVVGRGEGDGVEAGCFLEADERRTKRVAEHVEVVVVEWRGDAEAVLDEGVGPDGGEAGDFFVKRDRDGLETCGVEVEDKVPNGVEVCCANAASDGVYVEEAVEVVAAGVEVLCGKE